MDDPSCCSNAEAIAAFEGHEHFPDLVRLIARGDPVEVEDLAGSIGRPTGEVEQILRAQAGTDWDEKGRLIGFGLTLRPTPHRFSVCGRTLYTWCAADTFLFTLILGTPAVAESTCPVTGQEIRVALNPDAVVSISPPEAVISERLGSNLGGDLRGEVCDHGHFFSSQQAAAGWAVAHEDGEVLGVTEAFERARATCEALGWLPEDRAS
ncbi:MAG: organomercurial lyase MerB [Acidimicrobiales bacterium]